MSAIGAASQDLPLPALRDELTLIEGPPALDDAPTWNIFDPVRNRYFRIGWLPFQLISRWASGTVNALLERVVAEGACDVTADDVADVVKFLYANGLTRDPPGGDTNAYITQYEASRIQWFKWLVHHYLFFKIPLVRPTRFLQATEWIVEPLFSRTARNLVLFCGVLGLYLAARQWDEFVTTFLHFFTLEGFLLYGFALAFVKICHELGHAYTATRYRCNVPTMGLAFLVMFPVLYTDATDAWRLRSRRQRLHIGAAGMVVELGIAMVSTFLWAFLPDGPLRSAAFLTATTSWILSLTVNLNPFMRFDGYYMLSDWWGVQSLQNRAFAVGKWQLRELLFKANLPVPETFERPLAIRLTLYAWGTWIYRLLLFVAIALLVYHLFFKLLGIFLFLVEILWLISLPIAKELLVWWQMRKTIVRTKRFYISAGVVLALCMLTLIPWSGRISLPALLETSKHTTVYPPAPGRIASVHVAPDQQVEKGDILLVLESPEIDNDLKQTRRRLQVLALRAARNAADLDERANMHVVLESWKTESAKLAGLEALQRRLVIRAPVSGKISNVDDELHAGRWVNPQLAVARIVQPDVVHITALSLETHLRWLEPGLEARFYPDDARRPRVEASVAEVNTADVRTFDLPYLASTYGGEIAVHRDEDGKLVPEESVYRVRLSPVEAADRLAPEQAVRGVVHVSGPSRSFAERVTESVAAVLIRESGF